jgi:hypothetical protein
MIFYPSSLYCIVSLYLNRIFKGGCPPPPPLAAVKAGSSHQLRYELVGEIAMSNA